MDSNLIYDESASRSPKPSLKKPQEGEKKKKVLILAGPTATGKTDLSL